MGNYRTFGTALDRVFRNDLNNNFSDIANDINAQKTRVDNLITGTPQPSEVVDARGGKAVLKDRLDAVDASLAESASVLEGKSQGKPLNKGIITFIYDDANISQYQTVYPLHQAKGLPAGLAIDVYNFRKGTGKLTRDNALEMQDAGWEILSHAMNHVKIDNAVSFDQGQWELKESYRVLRGFGFSVKQFVAPSSYLESTHYPTLQKIYDAAFTVYANGVTDPVSSIATNPSNFDPYRMTRANMQGMTLDRLKSFVDYVEQNKVWLVFYEHNIGTGAPYTDTQTLSDLLDYIKTKNIEVLTPTNALNKTSTSMLAKEKPSRLNSDIINEQSQGIQNLLNNAEFMGGSLPYSWTWDVGTLTGGVSTTTIDAGLFRTLSISLDGTNTGISENGQFYQDLPVTTGQMEILPYAFSIFCKATGANRDVKVRIVPMNGTTEQTPAYEATFTPDTVDFRRFDIAGIIPNNGTTTAIRVIVSPIQKAVGNGTSFYFNRPKFEVGTKPSGWSRGYAIKNAFSGKSVSGISIASGAWTKVNIASKDFDTANTLDTTNFKFTPKAKGQYILTGSVGFQTGVEGARMIISIYKNGVAFKNRQLAMSGATQQGIDISCIVDVALGDYFELYIFQSSGSSLTIQTDPYTWFTGSQL